MNRNVIRRDEMLDAEDLGPASIRVFRIIVDERAKMGVFGPGPAEIGPGPGRNGPDLRVALLGIDRTKVGQRGSVGGDKRAQHPRDPSAQVTRPLRSEQAREGE